jgi:hypothetical protein
MITCISRDTTQPTNEYGRIFFNVTIQAIYPSACLGIVICQTLFRQEVLWKFLNPQPFYLSVPLVDGENINFEAQLISLIQYYGKYEYASGDNIPGRYTEIREIKSFEILEKSLIFFFFVVLSGCFNFFQLVLLLRLGIICCVSNNSFRQNQFA